MNKTTETKTTTKKTTTKKALPKALPEKVVRTSEQKTTVSAEMKKNFSDCTKLIKKELENSEKSFIKIGYALHKLQTLYTTNDFVKIGYLNIYDYAKKEFGIARGTTSDFINVITQFGKYIDNNLNCELDDKWKDYTSSKLCIMATMTDEQLAQVKPEMTVKQIKAIKDKKEKAPKTKKGVRKSASDKTENDENIVEDDVTISNVVISFRTVEEYNKNIDRLDDLILRCLKAGHTVNVSELVRTSEQ